MGHLSTTRSLHADELPSQRVTKRWPHRTAGSFGAFSVWPQTPRVMVGLPIAHKCRILPPESISAAIAGGFDRAVTLLAKAAARGPLPDHPGILRLRRR